MPIPKTFVAVTLLFPLTAFAGDECKEAYEKGYTVGKDLQELRGEVKQLKSALAELMELDRQKMALLKQLLGKNVDLPETTVTVVPDQPPVTPTKKKGNGIVTGKIGFLEGNKLAYVYIENVRGRLARGRKVTVAQKNRQFRPRWLVVQRGTTVTFPNEDSTYHNVFAKDPSATFDLGIYRKGDDPKSYTFTKAGLIDIFCNMHAKMRAEVLVVPNHIYTKVRPDGSFKLSRVPPGRRKIVAWGPGAEMVSKFVNVGAGKTTSLSLSLRPRKRKQHTNKNGQPYGSYK